MRGRLVQPLADRQCRAGHRGEPRVVPDLAAADHPGEGRGRLTHQFAAAGEPARVLGAGHQLDGAPSVGGFDTQRAGHEDLAGGGRVAAPVDQSSEQVLGVGAKERVSCVRERSLQQFLGARAAAGAPVHVGGGERALRTRLARWRQPGGTLQGPGRDGVAAARACPLRHRRELGRDFLVCAGRRRRPVPRTAVGLPLAGETGGERLVRAPPERRRRRLVDRGADQRMTKADGAVCHLDEPEQLRLLLGSDRKPQPLGGGADRRDLAGIVGRRDEQQ